MYRRLVEVLGTEQADTLMAHLPPVPSDPLATSSDLGLLRTDLRSEMHALRTELRSEMNVGFADVRTEMISAMNRQIRWMVGFAAVWTSFLVTAVRFTV